MSSSSKHVRETKAAKSITAFVVMKRHREVAKVLAHYSDGGTVLVNVFNYGDKNKSAETLPFQAGKASGYGYDKFTAALAGLYIDGHRMTNHCEGHKKPTNGVFPEDSVAPKGWHYANYKVAEWRDDKRVDLPKDKQGYSDLYRQPGLEYLKKIGYNVISVL